MGTLYVTQEDCFIGKTDERLNVTSRSKVPVGSGFRSIKETLIDVPMIKVDGVVAVGRATVSPAAISELLDRNIPLSFLTATGRYLGRLEGSLSHSEEKN